MITNSNGYPSLFQLRILHKSINAFYTCSSGSSLEPVNLQNSIDDSLLDTTCEMTKCEGGYGPDVKDLNKVVKSFCVLAHTNGRMSIKPWDLSDITVFRIAPPPRTSLNYEHRNSSPNFNQCLSFLQKGRHCGPLLGQQ